MRVVPAIEALEDGEPDSGLYRESGAIKQLALELAVRARVERPLERRLQLQPGHGPRPRLTSRVRHDGTGAGGTRNLGGPCGSERVPT